MNTTERTKMFFNCLADNWDKNCIRDLKKIEVIIMLADIKRGSHVVDIGCGTGILFEEILARQPDELLGVDFSDRMIAVAENKFHDIRLRLTATDVFALNENGFDAAIIYSAYPHFLDKQKLAGKVADMLVPGGRIIIAHSESSLCTPPSDCVA
ncbi:MAG: class I SAM-dependent DNA methyltransferase [Lacrimispora sphenoides]